MIASLLIPIDYPFNRTVAYNNCLGNMLNVSHSVFYINIDTSLS